MNRRVFAVAGIAAILTGQAATFPQTSQTTPLRPDGEVGSAEGMQASARKAVHRGTAMVQMSENANALVTGVKKVAGSSAAVQ